jgi:hypothetical protein
VDGLEQLGAAHQLQSLVVDYWTTVHDAAQVQIFKWVAQHPALGQLRLLRCPSMGAKALPALLLAQKSKPALCIRFGGDWSWGPS